MASPPPLPPRKSAATTPVLGPPVGDETPPPLPSREGRRHVTNSAPAVGTAVDLAPTPTSATLPPIAASSPPSTSIPPPLPPRAVPPSLNIPSQESTPHVNITPATPLQQQPPVSVTAPSLGQGADAIRSAPLPTTAHQLAIHPPTSAPLPSQPSQASSSPAENKTGLSGILPLDTSGPAAQKIEQTLSKMDIPPVEALILAALLLNLIFGQLNVLLVTLIGGCYALYRFRGGCTHSLHEYPAVPVRPGEGNEAVQWVNHALYALFPLISTDVLTPFIDLLEDALIQQVPPIVTSVRLTSAALGAQPMLLTGLRPMSDQEWFASLAPVSKHAEHRQTKSGHKVPLSGRHSGTKTHTRSASSGSRLSRSASASSVTSALNPDEIASEAQKRRKRDRILQKVSRRRAMHGSTPNSPATATSAATGRYVERGAGGPGEEAQVPDGDRVVGGNGEDAVEQDDPNAGQYVNYQVGFEYRRTESTEKKGWGLHVLAYFGWGVKGVGKSEIPVYIDVLGVKGTINVRLLLSATPPFVRTATFSFPCLPEFDISAKPLRRGSFNAMELPGMKTYVQKSIAEVAKAFVRPESYSIDVDRLLLGREASLRTHTVGVLHIVLHGAEDLPKTDTVGSCDPYVMICLTKFRKPVFSTRTIIDTQNPSWEEEAFVLVSADAIESGERLRLRLVDSDRFSADDSMGVVEVEIPELVEQAESFTPDQGPIRRVDMLTPERPGMKTSGKLEWSVRFCPLWTLSPEELERRIESKMHVRPGEPGAKDMALPPWLSWIERYMDVPDWEADREKRRQETIAWFTGEREREEIEAAAPPTDELRSGILQFHIHQCVDLEVDSTSGTYSSTLNRRLSAASGKPALAAEVDRTPAENPEPPSAYCEVHLNDRMVYRTRTKQVTPLPYFNAVSERFLRDWRMAKIVFVVRDERDREHDPILGMVTLYLKDVLKDNSHFTRWFPLSAGLGWGRIRISLLFKPIEIHLPPRVSGYEIATLQIKSLAATDLSGLTERNISVMLETESDRIIIDTSTDADTSHSRASVDSIGSVGEGPMTAGLVTGRISDAPQVEWAIDRPIRLAVEYRHSCSIVISFIVRSKVVKKKRVLGLATVRLDENPDEELCEKTVPIFATNDVKDAVKGTAQWVADEMRRENERGIGEGDLFAPATPAPNTPGSTRPGYSRTGSSSRRSLRRISSAAEGTAPKIIGYVTLASILHPGISRAHRKVCKKDLRFAKVYEAWEAYRDVVTRRARTREDTLLWSERVPRTPGTPGTPGSLARGDANAGELDDLDMDESDTTEDDDSNGDEQQEDSGKYGEALRRTTSERELYDDNDDKRTGLFAEQRAHSKALHKKHKGIFQLKIVRTGQFVKDKLEAKVRSKNADRRRGADLDVEHAGQSAL